MTARGGRWRARAAGLAALATILALQGCAAGGGARAARTRAHPDASSGLPVFDSATVLLWHLDESTGVRVYDGNGDDLTGTAGLDTHPELGRYGGARGFTRSVESFVWMASRPEIQLTREITVEAWIRLDAYGQYEDTPIAGCWDPGSSAQSWFLAVGGRNLQPPLANLASPGFHSSLLFAVASGSPQGRLMFGYQPRQAGAPQAYLSNATIELDRWTHVAASFDSKVIRLFINGQLDSQYAVSDEIRPSEAPLVVGNLLEAREFTTFGGDLHILEAADRNPYYAFEGSIDELRISNVARTEFPGVR